MAAKPTRNRKRRVSGPSKPARRRRLARPRIRARRISARAKTLAIGAEPPIDRDPDHLVPEFWTRLQRALEQLAAAGTPFRFHEGFRTVERQQWLYGSGRPRATFGRPGAIVTNADGVGVRSNHQGNGAAGSGRAADCYPLRDGRVIIPALSDPLWKAYAEAARAHGLTAGLYWPRFQDAPHCELPTG
ncbi:MAG TPA: M15 family metallopeptidase [Methylomirabilota bacterium]|nr:M15 family metallopeptidase [Methylomirabilota bacterium]